MESASEKLVRERAQGVLKMLPEDDAMAISAWLDDKVAQRKNDRIETRRMWTLTGDGIVFMIFTAFVAVCGIEVQSCNATDASEYQTKFVACKNDLAAMRRVCGDSILHE